MFSLYANICIVNDHPKSIHVLTSLMCTYVALVEFGYPVYDLWFSCSQRLSNYLAFQSFDLERTSWRCAMLDIYICIYQLYGLLAFLTYFSKIWNRLKIVHIFFSHCIGSNHVKLRTRFCFKNNARRVLRSPSARADTTMAKGKRTITDLQNTTQKTITSPTAIYFFTGNKNQIFIFWT